MTKVDSDRFVDFIRLSRTVDEPELVKALAKASDDLKASSEKLGDHFVEIGLLTRWQCDNLIAGKHKGFRLGNYRLKRKLGRGGMSTVYLAEHALMKREAAIKVLPRRRVEDSSYLARFHREAQAAAALDHINVVRIYDVDADGNTHFIAMEFIDGQDLQTRVVNDGRLDFDLAADYIAQSALGLQHAHDIGLIHRDIKPANLLANEHGIVKILDMGLAKFDGDDDEASLTKDHNENVLGTVDYLSPEQARDSHSVDHRADIYSLGCTLYFLLVGNAPFPEGTLAQRILKHQQKTPTPIEDKRGDVPPTLIDICNQMMSKDPDARPQCGNDVAALLSDYLASRGKNVTGASDSSSGSRIGLAASIARNMANTPATQVDPMDVDSLIATVDPETSEAKKDTTISRSQDETRKTATPKKPAVSKAKTTQEDDLGLAPTDDGAKGKATAVAKGPRNREDDEDVDLGDLEQQLSSFESGDDLMTTKVRVGTRLQSRDTDEGIPVWVWIVAAVAGVVIVGGVIVFAVL